MGTKQAMSGLLPAWAADGVRFECQGSGKCCISRGAIGFVYLTKSDRRRLAAFLGLSPSVFTRRYCRRTDGHWHLVDPPGARDCRFLEQQRCRVYEARPTQCRTWPFWPEVMNAKVWQREVASYCPGVGRGRLWRPEEIEAVLIAQRAAEESR